jgi:hypothetical protein
MLIIWGIGERAPSEPEKAHIGHLSVKWNGRWESKLSTEYYASERLLNVRVFVADY